MDVLTAGSFPRTSEPVTPFLRHEVHPLVAHLLRLGGTPRLPWRGAAPWLAVGTTWSRRAERRAGEMLAEMEKNPGGNPNQLDEQTSYPPTLNELGISKFQSHHWQLEASVPDQWEGISVCILGRRLAPNPPELRWFDVEMLYHLPSELDDVASGVCINGVEFMDSFIAPAFYTHCPFMQQGSDYALLIEPIDSVVEPLPLSLLVLGYCLYTGSGHNYCSVVGTSTIGSNRLVVVEDDLLWHSFNGNGHTVGISNVSIQELIAASFSKFNENECIAVFVPAFIDFPRRSISDNVCLPHIGEPSAARRTQKSQIWSSNGARSNHMYLLLRFLWSVAQTPLECKGNSLCLMQNTNRLALRY